MMDLSFFLRPRPPSAAGPAGWSPGGQREGPLPHRSHSLADPRALGPADTGDAAQPLGGSLPQGGLSRLRLRADSVSVYFAFLSPSETVPCTSVTRGFFG